MSVKAALGSGSVSIAAIPAQRLCQVLLGGTKAPAPV